MCDMWEYQLNISQKIFFVYLLLIEDPTLLMGAMAFFFPLRLRSARETLSGCLGSSSLSSSSTFIMTWRDTRACKALRITIQKIVIVLIYCTCFNYMSKFTGWIRTCETAGAYCAAPHTSWILPGRPGLLCDSCPDSHIPQTKRCRAMPVSLLFPEPACTWICPRAPGSSLPNDTQYTCIAKVITDASVCQSSKPSQRLQGSRLTFFTRSTVAPNLKFYGRKQKI